MYRETRRPSVVFDIRRVAVTTEWRKAMPRTISFIAAVAAALAVAVPIAAAEGQPTGTHSAEAAKAAARMLDARERAFEAKQVASPASDWLERFAAAHSRHDPVVDDRFRIDPTADAPVAVSSGREFEWPALGLGLGLLIAIALCTYVVTRTYQQRPLAH